MQKLWKELTIADNFLFQAVLKNKRICKKLIEEILHIEIDDISYPEGEKTIALNGDSKNIRLDIFVTDKNGVVYDIEMQTTNDAKDLAKRMRYYQGMIDINHLERGEDYSDLPKSYIIFICTFDPIGEGLYQYTFRTLCKENPAIELNDEATKIFLNSKGKTGNVSTSLKGLMDYINGNAASGDFASEVAEEVSKVHANKELEMSYMTLQMELNRTFKAGREEGREEGRIGIIKNMLKNNVSIADIAKMTNIPITAIQNIALEMD